MSGSGYTYARPRPRTRMLGLVRLGRWLMGLLTIVVVAGISYVIVLPLLTKLSTSFKEEVDLFDSAVKWIPRNFTLDNYRLVWNYMQYPRTMMNSLGLALIVAVLQTAACTAIGYGLARFDFKGNGLLFNLVILVLIIPPQVLMTPLYLSFRYFDVFGLLPKPLNLINTPYPLLLMSMTGTGLRNGLFIYIARQFFKGLPTELEEAAYVDGAGLFRTFYSVMLPCAVPALVIIFLFAVVWQWNDNFYSTLFMQRLSLMPNELSSVAQRYAENVKESGSTLPGSPTSVTSTYLSILDSAGMVLYVFPLLTLYAFMQRYFVESVERTGLIG